MPEQSKKALIVMVSILAAMWACPALAKVSGPCANCHTMHNSQNGEAVGEGPWDLLSKDCVGCHTAADGDTWQDPVTGAPIVYNLAEPTYGADAGDGKKQGLAAGNFYWVDQDDSFGHNIFSDDPDLDMAPGRYRGCLGADTCHENLNKPYSYRGTVCKECKCCHTFWNRLLPYQQYLHRYHHADDSATVINSNNQGWYRFLGTVHGSYVGAWGIEDPDWEYTASSTDHNEYLGLSGDKSSADGLFHDNGKSVSDFCVGCHGYMHQQSADPAGGNWLRHPSDAVIPATGEYAGYTVYDPLTPVARPSLTAVSAVVTPGTDMVMCLSCHRAHGSPYPDMLRFPYDQMLAGGGGLEGKGCFKCHSNKDGT